MAKSKVLSVLVAVLLCAGKVTYAQVTTSSVSGKVTDGKEVLTGATVKATHVPSGTVYETVTRSDGSYNLMNLRIGGPYTIKFSYLGYSAEAVNDVYLTLGEDYRRNVALKADVQTLDEIVIVAADNSVISASRTGAQEIITRKKMDKLPTFNRSLNDFAKLTPMSSIVNGGVNFGGVSYRFNNATVDGASFNNSFGVSAALSVNGTEPISLEALEQVQVMVAPYDVRNGGFTGAGVNSVTKAGSNDFHASAYTYVKSPDLRGYRAKNQILPVNEFSNHQYGISLSGAIIKNKLFYYISGEIDRQQIPISYTTKNSAADAAVLQDLSDFLKTELDYDPGEFDVPAFDTQADRLTARIDWNINLNNALSVKYYHLNSSSAGGPAPLGAPNMLLGRGPNQYSIPFSSSFRYINSDFDIWIADLDTKISDNASNSLKVGYSRIRDYHVQKGSKPFPQVDILSADGNILTTFGTEANAYNTMLNSDIWQIQDNFVLNLDKHQLTFGTQSDYREFVNGFAQNYLGAWRFNSVEDFKQNVLQTKNESTITAFPVSFAQKFSINDDFPYARVNVFQIGLYAQDKWSVNDRLNLTFGLRVDIPVFTTELPTNDAVAAETYRDGIKVDVSKYPNTKPLFSPRFGFNYRPAAADESLQLRGGTGLFAGIPAYTWISNQAGNNGVLVYDVSSQQSEYSNLGFTGDPDAYKPKDTPKTVRADIAVTDPNFKYPNLWKNNVAVDYTFDGWIATVELLYSKDLHAIYFDNIGLCKTENYVNDGSGTNSRPLYNGYYSDESYNKKAANNVYLLRNTSKGYSFYTTLQLQKTFASGVHNEFYVNGSYSFGKSKNVSDGLSPIAAPAWQGHYAIDPSSQELGYSAGSFDGRLLLSAFYTANWSKNAATNIGFIYQRYRPFRYSYVYGGDANGDKAANDLIYIPKSLEEITDNLEQGDFDSKDEAWAVLDAFIEQDPYLSKHRGEYAERNGAVAPWANQLDFNIYHDIKVFQSNGRAHTLRFSLAVDNFLNLLNKDWGVQRTAVNSQFLTAARVENNVLKYQVQKGLSETFTDAASYWQAIFGIKYIF